ncbi:hypothetical protein LSAT2_031365 [Lamellibrachia satsuma]|nr:hypothetical protein LSAT2_031365 [Lamellibrachia satsuma]
MWLVKRDLNEISQEKHDRRTTHRANRTSQINKTSRVSRENEFSPAEKPLGKHTRRLSQHDDETTTLHIMNLVTRRQSTSRPILSPFYGDKPEPIVTQKSFLKVLVESIFAMLLSFLAYVIVCFAFTVEWTLIVKIMGSVCAVSGAIIYIIHHYAMVYYNTRKVVPSEATDDESNPRLPVIQE